MRRITAVLLLMVLLLSAASAPAEDFLLGVVPEPSDITPSFRSEEPRDGEPDDTYWDTPMNLDDEEAIWKMLTLPMTVADIDMNKQMVIYSKPDENSEGIGIVNIFQMASSSSRFMGVSQ